MGNDILQDERKTPSRPRRLCVAECRGVGMPRFFSRHVLFHYCHDISRFKPRRHFRQRLWLGFATDVGWRNYRIKKPFVNMAARAHAHTHMIRVFSSSFSLILVDWTNDCIMSILKRQWDAPTFQQVLWMRAISMLLIGLFTIFNITGSLPVRLWFLGRLFRIISNWLDEKYVRNTVNPSWPTSLLAVVDRVKSSENSSSSFQFSLEVNVSGKLSKQAYRQQAVAGHFMFLASAHTASRILHVKTLCLKIHRFGTCAD